MLNFTGTSVQYDQGKMARPSRIYNDPHGFRARRERLGLTQRELAEMAGTNHARVQALESSTPTGRDSSSVFIEEIRQALENAEERAKAGGPVKVAGPVKSARIHPSVKGRIPVFATVIGPNGPALSDVVTSYVRTMEHLEQVHDVIAKRVRSTDMFPMFRPGDIVILNPFGSPQPGSGVMLCASEGNGVALREYISEDGNAWTVRLYGDNPRIETVSKAAFPKLYLVEGVMLGR